MDLKEFNIVPLQELGKGKLKLAKIRLIYFHKCSSGCFSLKEFKKMPKKIVKMFRKIKQSFSELSKKLNVITRSKNAKISSLFIHPDDFIQNKTVRARLIRTIPYKSLKNLVVDISGLNFNTGFGLYLRFLQRFLEKIRHLEGFHFLLPVKNDELFEELDHHDAIFTKICKASRKLKSLTYHSILLQDKYIKTLAQNDSLTLLRLNIRNWLTYHRLLIHLNNLHADH